MNNKIQYRTRPPSNKSNKSPPSNKSLQARQNKAQLIKILSDTTQQNDIFIEVISGLTRKRGERDSASY